MDDFVVHSKERIYLGGPAYLLYLTDHHVLATWAGSCRQNMGNERMHYNHCYPGDLLLLKYSWFVQQ